MNKNISISLLVLMLFSTSVTFGDGGGLDFYYCDKNKYYDVVMVKFAYKKITLKSLKVNGTPAQITAIPNDYYFHEEDQLFLKSNKSFDGIGEININGQMFEAENQ